MESEFSIGSSAGSGFGSVAVETASSFSPSIAPSIGPSFSMPGFEVQNTFSDINLGGSPESNFSLSNTETLVSVDSPASFSMPGFEIQDTFAEPSLGGSFEPGLDFIGAGTTDLILDGSRNTPRVLASLKRCEFGMTGEVSPVFDEGLKDIDLNPGSLRESISPEVNFFEQIEVVEAEDIKPAFLETATDLGIADHIDTETQTITIEQPGILTELEAQTLENAEITALLEKSEEAAQALELSAETEIETSVDPLAKVEPLTEEQFLEEVKSLTPELIDQEEEKEERKKDFKFVVDEKALASRNMALKQAVEKATFVDDEGNELVDSKAAAANMPTESESPDIISEILPKFVIEMFGLEKGDGSYRPFVDAISGLGIVSSESILESGQKINNELPPVAVKPSGREVGQKDVERVYEFKREPIRPLRSALSSR